MTAEQDQIDQITETLKSTEDPFVLADCLTKLAGWASYYTEMMKKVQLVKPQRWLDIKQFLGTTNKPKEEWGKRERDLSDKHTDIVWAATEDGQKEIALHYELKRIEQMASAIKKTLYVKRVEYQNLNQNI